MTRIRLPLKNPVGMPQPVGRVRKGSGSESQPIRISGAQPQFVHGAGGLYINRQPAEDDEEREKLHDEEGEEEDDEDDEDDELCLRCLLLLGILPAGIFSGVVWTGILGGITNRNLGSLDWLDRSTTLLLDENEKETLRFLPFFSSPSASTAATIEMRQHAQNQILVPIIIVDGQDRPHRKTRNSLSHNITRLVQGHYVGGIVLVIGSACNIPAGPPLYLSLSAFQKIHDSVRQILATE